MQINANDAPCGTEVVTPGAATAPSPPPLLPANHHATSHNRIKTQQFDSVLVVVAVKTLTHLSGLIIGGDRHKVCKQ